jgi:Pyridoxamine 5'-phosphate oxidase
MSPFPSTAFFRKWSRTTSISPDSVPVSTTFGKPHRKEMIMSMQEPVTELDERFSDAGVEATPWATTREVLQEAQLSWVSTVRADGRPHVTPLVPVWLDDAVHFTTGPASRRP